MGVGVYNGVGGDDDDADEKNFLVTPVYYSGIE